MKILVIDVGRIYVRVRVRPMMVNNLLEPMELAHLPYRKGKTYEDCAGLAGLERLGKKRWRHHVEKIVELLRNALRVEDVVIGGGNA